MKYRNATIVGLMISSVILLVILEGLWLYRSYEKEHFDLRRETDFHLTTTVAEMRDSVLMESIDFSSGDSLNDQPMKRDSFGTVTKIESRARRSDAPGEPPKSNVRIYITSPTDSVRKDIIRPFLKRLAEPGSGNTEGNRTIILRLNDDTLSTSSIRDRLTRRLIQHDLLPPKEVLLVGGHEALPLRSLAMDGFRIARQERSSGRHHSVFSDSIKSEAVAYAPGLQYEASFIGVRTFILGRLKAEILFALFLAALTCGAFALVFKNLRQQQRLITAKDDFISNVTHELKTPVATVSVALEALKNFNALDNPLLTREYIDIALKELNRLSLITDDILKTALLEQRPQDIRMKPVDLYHLAQGISEGMKILADSKHAEITVERRGDVLTIQGSAEHLSRALSNLLDNALKYSTVDPKIRVLVMESDEHVSISVKDNGVGIDSAYHRKIFEKFFRVPQGDVHSVKGYGLGLNYVASVAALHRGRIQVKSTPGSGSEFMITLPKI